LEILYLEWHDEVTIGLLGILTCNTAYHDRGEGILVFEAHIVLADDGECLEDEL
jgi:hypothetical protein